MGTKPDKNHRMSGSSQQKRVGVAGTGAIGSAVIRALQKGIPGYQLAAASDIRPDPELKVPYVDFEELAERCDLIIEALPAAAVPALAQEVFKCNRDLMVVSSAALVLYPQILDWHKNSKSRIIVPSGAIAGLDGVAALRESGITYARIASSKPPKGFTGAPYIIEKGIDLNSIKEKTLIFSGNAFKAAQAFPANVNVSATLSLAGIGPAKTQVEVWADPNIQRNTHEIKVESKFSCITCRIENAPDPANPKTSMLAAHSVISTLSALTAPLVVL